MSKNGRVLVAMSGGIDSSMTAIMLQNKGYEVVGATIKTWDYESSGVKDKGTCCSIKDINDAKILAEKFNFKHYVIDLREDFEQKVIKNFIDEYSSGRTPNPCIICNNTIKWGALFDLSNKIECDFIATGHYAQVRVEQGRCLVVKGVDPYKDQSYVLWGLKQPELKRTLMPLGKYLKSDLKQMARDLGLRRLAEKKESYDICFVPQNNYRLFLQHKLSNGMQGGEMVNEQQEVIGRHEGLAFYTIGQRKGLGIARGKPLYVKKLDTIQNRVMVSGRGGLDSVEAVVKDINLIKYDKLDTHLRVSTKARYRDRGTESTIEQLDKDTIKISFEKPVFAIAPGQSAVFYEQNDVVGGGKFV